MQNGDDPTASRDTEAATWFARNRAGALSQSAQADFARWLALEDNRRAYAACEGAWTKSAAVSDEPEIILLREVGRRRMARRRFLTISGAAAASAVLGFGVWTSRDIFAGSEPGGAERYATSLGQVSRILLPDRSEVVLDADSQLSVRFDRRRRVILLEKGRALFVVAHEARPFVVTSEGFSVRATGTQFVVDTIGRGRVGMIDGSVAVSAPQAQERAVLPLKAGMGLRVTDEGRWLVTAVDAKAEQSWIDGQLIFHKERIDNIAEEVSRYSRVSITVADPRVASRQLSAVLRAGDVETFVAAVTDLNLARAERRSADAIALVAP